jgi:hypothetical protein
MENSRLICLHPWGFSDLCGRTSVVLPAAKVPPLGQQTERKHRITEWTQLAQQRLLPLLLRQTAAPQLSGSSRLGGLVQHWQQAQQRRQPQRALLRSQGQGTLLVSITAWIQSLAVL